MMTGTDQAQGDDTLQVAQRRAMAISGRDWGQKMGNHAIYHATACLIERSDVLPVRGLWLTLLCLWTDVHIDRYCGGCQSSTLLLLERQFRTRFASPVERY